MLVQFKMKNVLSFKEETIFDMTFDEKEDTIIEGNWD